MQKAKTIDKPNIYQWFWLFIFYINFCNPHSKKICINDFMLFSLIFS